MVRGLCPWLFPSNNSTGKVSQTQRSQLSMDKQRKCPLEDFEEARLMVHLDGAKESGKFS